MGWILLLLTLFTYCSGSFSQFTLTQPPFHSASLGDTTQLPCTISRITFGGFNWYQQKEGKNPKFLLRYEVWSDETKFGSEVSGNFSASADNPKKVAYLTITNLQEKDEATYYCGAGYSNNSIYMYVFGGGTTLTVTGQPPSPPTVNVFPPSSEEKESKDKVTVVCLVNDFSPPTISVIWQADDTTISNGVETTRPTKISDKYAVSSYLTLTPSKWESYGSISCKVTHEGTEYVKSVSHSQCP